MARTLSPEQQRLVNWLKDGSKPRYMALGFFSKRTIESLRHRGIIKGDIYTGEYEFIKKEA